ncbi:MAG TPA: hypothetical protein VHM64_01620 [Candidatus Binatia bacterium]|nr:hypothetical protein [Candidatus Binatia bacterium]
MNEIEIIDDTYARIVEQLCSQLFNVLLPANNIAEYEDAEKRFQAGVRRAREIRERAKQLLVAT